MFILNQAEGALSLGVVLGLGMLTLKLPGDLYFLTPVWN